jgi:hypothetical protein
MGEADAKLNTRDPRLRIPVRIACHSEPIAYQLQPLGVGAV